VSETRALRLTPVAFRRVKRVRFLREGRLYFGHVATREIVSLAALAGCVYRLTRDEAENSKSCAWRNQWPPSITFPKVFLETNSDTSYLYSSRTSRSDGNMCTRARSGALALPLSVPASLGLCNAPIENRRSLRRRRRRRREATREAVPSRNRLDAYISFDPIFRGTFRRALRISWLSRTPRAKYLAESVRGARPVAMIIAGNGNEWKSLQCGFPYCMTHCSTIPDIKLKGLGNWILVMLHTNWPAA